ncbi:MAG: CHRD domain-containing protein [Chitinophagaceae bacterium]
MKRFFQSAMTISLVLLVASCGDGATTSTDTTSKDSNMSTMDNNSSASNMSSTSEATQKTISLGSDQEVPVNDSKATGNADISYNKETQTLTYKVTYSGLTDKPTMAHIHGTAAKGVNAGVKQDLSGVLVKETSGSFTDSVKVDGTKIKEDSLLSGFYYINIHTPKHPGGEIRGQITF